MIGGTQPYAEDSWRIVRILCTAGPGAATAAGRPGLEARAPEGGSPLSSAVVLRSAGPCTRCDMVCADPATGKRSGPEPLLTLAGYRRSRGRISFGLLANLEEQPQRWPLAAAPWVAVGAAVHAAGKG